MAYPHLIISLLLLQAHICYISCSDSEELAVLPYELVYFKIDSASSFNPSSKYPPFRRCILRELLNKNNAKVQSVKTWRLYWSKVGWSAYFFENGNELTNWEHEKENGHLKPSYWNDYTIPILIMIVWIFIAGWVCLFLFPLLGMLVFRLLFMIWNFATNKFFIEICRWIVIKIVKSRRDDVRRILRDEGRRPPRYKYYLPKFLRRNSHEELDDDSEEEFWSSDDELNNMGEKYAKWKNKVYKPTPEFTPDYPTEHTERAQLLSNDMFNYLVKVKQHGMFAVWTEGTTDVNLEEISTSHNKNLPKLSSKEELVDQHN